MPQDNESPDSKLTKLLTQEMQSSFDSILGREHHACVARRIHVSEWARSAMMATIHRAHFGEADPASELDNTRMAVIDGLLKRAISWPYLYDKEVSALKTAWNRLDDVSENAYRDCLLLFAQVAEAVRSEAYSKRAKFHAEHQSERPETLLAELTYQRRLMAKNPPLASTKAQAEAPLSSEDIATQIHKNFFTEHRISSSEYWNCAQLAMKAYAIALEQAVAGKRSDGHWNPLKPAADRHVELKHALEVALLHDAQGLPHSATEQCVLRDEAREHVEQVTKQLTTTVISALLTARQLTKRYELN